MTMNLLNWFCAHDQGAPPDLTFDDVANQFEDYRIGALSYEQNLQDSESQLRKAQAEISKLQKTVQQLRSENGGLRNTINKQKADQKNQQAQLAGLNGLVQSLKKKNASILTEHSQLQTHIHETQDRSQDLLLELELLKCTAPSRDLQDSTASMQLTPQSFVAVLIDGDAYNVGVLPCTLWEVYICSGRMTSSLHPHDLLEPWQLFA